MYDYDDLYQDSYYPDDEDNYIDYYELSWDDADEMEGLDNWPNLTLWQKIKNYLWRPIMWYREKTGYYDDIPF